MNQRNHYKVFKLMSKGECREINVVFIEMWNYILNEIQRCLQSPVFISILVDATVLINES